MGQFSGITLTNNLSLSSTYELVRATIDEVHPLTQTDLFDTPFSIDELTLVQL